MSEERLRVLLVDDEESLRVPLEKYLENNFGYQVDTAATGEEALRLVEKAGGCYDIALIDDLLTPRLGEEPRPIGIELMGKIKECCPETEAIVFTGWSRLPGWDKDRALAALRAGAYRYIEKPFDNDELAMLIRTAAQQVRLRAIGRAILSEQDLDRVLEGIAGAACSLALADEAAIALLDRATGKIRVHTKTYPAELEWRRHFRDQDLSGEIIQTGQMVRVPDTEQDARVDQKVITAGIRSFVGVPIPGESGNLGALYAYSQKPGRFAEWGTVAVLQTLAGQAGLAITNAQAFQQIKAHAGYMEALVRAGQGLTKATSLGDQLNLAWNFVREQLKVSTFFVALYDKQTDMLSFPLHYDEGQPVEIPERRLGDDPTQWGIAGYVVKTGCELYWPTQDDKERQCCSLGIKAIRIGKPCQSCFYLPLKIGDEVIGAVSIQSYDRYAFTPILLDACRALGSQLTAALENARLFKAEARRRQEAETLREAALALTTTLEREEVFEGILAELQKVVPYDSASVQLLKGNQLEIIGGRGFPNLPELLGISFRIDGDNPNREVVCLRAPFIVPDAPAVYKGFTQEPHVQAGIRGWLGVPMLVGDRLIGMIALDKREPGFYTEEHARLAQAFATQAAIAIENAQLFQEAKKGRDYIRSLYQASSAIISPAEPNQVLQAIVETVRKSTGAWRAVVLLVDEGNQPQVLAQAGFDHHLEPTTAIRPTGISRQVIQSKQPRFFPSTQAAANEVHPRIIEQGTKAAACLPLLLRDRAIGVLWIQFREVHPFSEAEQQALQVYASQAAIAYDNARRMQELEHLRKAAEALAGALEPSQVLQQIVESAREVLQADSSAIWSYDNVRNQFIPEELVAYGIPRDELERFRKKEPKRGGTADTVMDWGWVGVTDVSDPQYGFMGPSTLDLLVSIGAMAFQGIALQAGDEKLGVLYVNYNHPRGFTDEDRKTLEVFSSHAALALKKARLLKQLDIAREAAALIAEVTVAEDLGNTLQSIVEETATVLGADAVTLYPYVPETEQFGHPPAMFGVRNEEPIRRLSEARKGTAVWKIFELDRLYFAEDAPSDIVMNGRFVREEEIKSSAGIPLKAKGITVGVMFINYRSRHRFTNSELVNIRLFADQAAVAIRNAQLYEETTKRAKALQALYEASQAITGTLTLNELLKRIVKQAWRLAEPRGEKTHFSHLALVDGKCIKFVAAHPSEMLTTLQKEIDLDKDVPIGITGRVVQNYKSRLVGNVLEDPDYIKTDPRICSQLSVPIQMGEQIIGVISVEHPDFNAFDSEDQRVLESLAAQAAVAIRNAQQYEELKHTKGLIGTRTALAWMGMVSSEWKHRIRNQAQTIQEQVQLLRRDLQLAPKHERPATVEDRLFVIERLAAQIQQKPIIPPLSAEEGVMMFAVNDLIVERAKQLWKNVPYQQAELRLDLRLDNTITVRASPEWLRRAFDILVDNAVEAVAGRETRRITIATRLADNRAEVAVSDTGPGIPSEVLSRLFEKQIEKPESAKGFGIGLLIAQAIVQTYDGDIKVESTGPMGTTMVIWLPLAK